MKICPHCSESSMTFRTFITMTIFSSRTCLFCGTKLHYRKNEKITFLISFILNAIVAMLILQVIGIQSMSWVYSVFYLLVAVFVTYYLLPLTIKND